MKQFIAFDDELNITNKEPDDAFSYLAGGEFYANTTLLYFYHFL